MTCKRCRADEDRIDGYCSVYCEDIHELEQELVAAREREARLRRVLADCMNYIDVDNLTMQTKYREWEQALRGKEG